MALTDMRCRTEKPSEKRKKLSDGHGLQLWIQPNGGKHWHLAYQFQRQQRHMSLGPYPEISLQAARDKREEVRRTIRNGEDPDPQRPPKGHGRFVGLTFKEIAHEYLEKRRREKLAPATMSKKEWLLDFAYPSLGKKKVSDIRPVDVLAVLQELEQRDCFESARRLRATIGAVCRYAIVTARAEMDPTQPLRGAITTPEATPRAAITDPKRLGALLRAIDGFDGQPTMIAGLKLMALLFPRPGELRLATWPEFDMDRQIWTIPAERTKMRRAHQIYLARQAVEIIEDLRKITGHRELLFPGIWTWKRPISENTLNLALRRMGYR
jgi:integrase